MWEWSTDAQTIPKTATLTGNDIVVTDGVFRFARMDVPLGMTVRLVGTKPVRLYVRGSVTLDGKLEANGAPIPFVTSVSATGQPGSAGGPGGSAGGKGADRCDGLGAQPRFDGQPGGDVALLPGHVYAARAVGTGGLGSRVFPATGQSANVTFLAVSNSVCGMVPAGGAGGSALLQGGSGAALASPSNELAPSAVPGAAFNPFPVPFGVASFEHFLIGGSGGGGGGSHPFFSSAPFVKWNAGAGGGGVLGFRIGSDLLIRPTGGIACRGGDAVTYAVMQQPFGPPSAGGWDLSVFGARASSGAGSAGFVRLEQASTPPVTALGTVRPPAQAANVGTIQGAPDADCAQQSLWYRAGELYAPIYRRYEIETNLGTFSDDPARGPAARFGSAAPVWFLAQACELDRGTGEPVPGTVKGWRNQVGRFVTTEPALDQDGGDAFRFVVVFHQPSVVIRAIRVIVEG